MYGPQNKIPLIFGKSPLGFRARDVWFSAQCLPTFEFRVPDAFETHALNTGASVIGTGGLGFRV